MTPERWRRIEALFDLAAKLPPEERSHFLDEECGTDNRLRHQLSEMLGTDSGSGETVAAIVEAAAAAAVSDPMEGRRLGPYRITAKIGSGGMGTVFRAVRDDQQFQKEVAIKALPFAADTSLISRFRYERNALAAMEHPNIAKVLDAGASDTGELYLGL